MNTYTIPPTLAAEIDELEANIISFQNGMLSDVELKARRVPFGVYEQRKKGTYMIRIRCAAGIITPSQFKKVAEIAKRYASGALHITTRQEIQIHDVRLEVLTTIMRELEKIGLSTRGGGGNTVRNVTASWDSGIAPNEVFDVEPHAIALTSYMIRLSDSWLLPRKYKIAFSNSSADNAFATVNDVGFIATIKNGQLGFRVFVAGGMGRQAHAGHLLHEFIPEADIFIVAEALKQLFSKFGNRKNKHAARLRFLYNTLGRERFIELYEAEKSAIAGLDQIPSFKEYINEAVVDSNIQPMIDQSEDFVQWKKRYVIAQKQEGLFSIRVPLLLGDLTADKAIVLSEVLQGFGSNSLRLTQDQNIAIRNIPEQYLGNIFNIVRQVTDLSVYPAIFGNAVACAGASTCQLGICLSRGALKASVEKLKRSKIDLDTMGDLRIHFSGCSNTCGQHSIAHLGFFGKASRKDERSYPAYTIVAGAILDPEKGSQLAEKVDEISARNIGEFIEEFLTHYGFRKSSYGSFKEYLEAEGKDAIHAISDKYRDIPSFDVDKNYYYDWGAQEVFSLAGRGTGECAAGLFDLIELDLASIRDIRGRIEKEVNSNVKSVLIAKLVLTSARMLLITKGAEASEEKDVYQLFERHFIDSGLVAEEFRQLLVIAQRDTNILPSKQSDVLRLSEAVEGLYIKMGDSLQFNQAGNGGITKKSEEENNEKQHVDLVKDFRGVACPMNFVKTKLALSQLKNGDMLQVLLDDGAPIENVPRSVEGEGHRIVNQSKRDNYWTVTIQKVGV